jgi:hypothetical protein
MKKYNPDIDLHRYITIPNHIHGIIEIAVGADSISAHSISAQKMAEMAERAEMDSAPTGTKTGTGTEREL